MCTSYMEKAYKQTIHTPIDLTLPIGFTQKNSVNLFVQKQWAIVSSILTSVKWKDKSLEMFSQGFWVVKILTGTQLLGYFTLQVVLFVSYQR